jgi:hypothetical protein
MPKQFLFKTVSKNLGTDAVVEIDDGLGTVIEIPAQASLSLNQQIAYEEAMSASSAKSNLGFMADVVAAMIRLYLDQPTMSRSEVLKDPEGNALTPVMIEKLYEHFAKVKTRFAPETQLLALVGPDAEKLATEYAKENHAVVATRSDLRINNQFYVFSSLSAVTALNTNAVTPWDVIASFEDPVAEGKSAGKSKPQTSTTTT